MAVYVDDMKASLGRMVMCHMLADSTDELLQMADTIGVQRKWIQHRGTYREHFDVCLSKREKAIAHGAKPVSQRQIGVMLRARRMEATRQAPEKPEGR